MNIELQSYWRDAAGTIHAELELVERLAGAENGIFVFTGKSGCGKSRILRQLKRQRPVRVFSTEEITDMLLAFCKESIHTSLSECLAATLSGFSCIAIEDIDLWYGKENTLAVIWEAVEQLAGDHLILLNGNDLELLLPELCRQPGIQLFQICQ